MNCTQERITDDPNIMIGKETIKGTRITIDIIKNKISKGISSEEILEIYPHLSMDDINAVLSCSNE